MTKKVSHINTTNVTREMKEFAVEDIANNFGLKKRNYDLLKFYALHCSDGFTPSEAFIERETGITQGNVSHFRKLLSDMHLITVTDNAVILDWEQLIDLARLDKDMMGRKQDTRRKGIVDPAAYYDYQKLPKDLRTFFLIYSSTFKEHGVAERELLKTLNEMAKLGDNKPDSETTTEEMIYKAVAAYLNERDPEKLVNHTSYITKRKSYSDEFSIDVAAANEAFHRLGVDKMVLEKVPF